MSDDYHAYLIQFHRLTGQENWLAALENVHTGEKKRFKSERDLLNFLLDTLVTDPSQEDAPADKPLPRP